MPSAQVNGLRALFVLTCLFGLVLPTAFAETVYESGTPEKTLSPYFVVLTKDPGEIAENLPLKSTRADATIAGVIAHVNITQVYQNRGQKPLEAVYVFPGSTRAAVHALKMTVGGRVIVAQVKERAQARQDYEQALQDGRTASLLEQQRPNVFQMNVGNILPGDEIQVELGYTELLVPRNKVYEFTIPAVVGPRYSNQPAGAAWVKNPYLHQGEKVPYAFDLGVTLHSGLAIARAASPSHAIDVAYDGANRARVRLKDPGSAGDRDFVLNYSLAGDRIESGLLLYPGEKENFFLLMMEPPKRTAPEMVVPREYVFILDVSGSMHGFPLDTTKALMKDLFQKLRPSDFFNILFFAGSNFVLSENSLPATPENVRRGLQAVDGQYGGGGTELMPALRQALSLPRREGVSRSAVIITDGYVSVEKEAFDYIHRNLDQANLFAFGIGSAVNRYLIEGLARAGMGEPFVVLRPDGAAAEAARFQAYIESPVLSRIQTRFHGWETYDVEPAVLPDLFAERPILVYGKYKGAPQGWVEVTGQTSAGAYADRLEVSQAAISPAHTALRYLWARQRITRLADMNHLDPQDERVQTVTRLGLDYNLLTDYTSFVAVDTVKRGDGKESTTVRQPLPLPQGVSDHAVGGPAAPRAGTGLFSSLASSYQPAEVRVEKQALKPEPAQPGKGGISVQLVSRQGSRTDADIIKVLEKAVQQPAWCASSTRGEVQLRMVIPGDGQPARVVVVKTTLRDKRVLNKLLELMKIQVWDQAPGQTEVVVSFLFPS